MVISKRKVILLYHIQFYQSILYKYRSNVLVDGQFNSKLGDFGFTKEMPIALSDSITLKTAESIAKTAGYAAPEIDICRHSVKTDVYSYGVVSFKK